MVLKFLYDNGDNRIEMFDNFCRKHFVLEVNHFLQSVHSHKNRVRIQDLHQSYNNILDQHIENGSPFEINISAFQKHDLLQFKNKDEFWKDVQEVHYSMFDPCCSTMQELLYTNFFHD
mmetsp:Transcript_8236/g.10205  ORF Transcript_8236/g.10205 Transcript_8236/m.10205 type:complete len:118 (-) Transcript_8236:44-397(-)